MLNNMWRGLLITLLMLVANVVKGSEQNMRFKASIMVASPSDEATQSMYGHAFIRMQYPAENLDYCFTLETINDNEMPWNFATGNYVTHVMAIKTKEYLKQFADGHRTIAQLPLNLTEPEIQNLWRTLDGFVVKRDHVIASDFFTNGCSSELMQILISAIDGYIDFDPIVADSIGNTRFKVGYTYRPKSNLGIVALSFCFADGMFIEQSSEFLAYAPVALPYMFSHASIVKDENRRPLLSSNTATVYMPDKTTQTKQVGAVYFFPRDSKPPLWIYLTIWLALQIAVCCCFRRCVKAVSITMFIAYNIIVLTVYLAIMQTCVTEFFGWKWQYLFYNPLPIALWLANRLRPFAQKTKARIHTVVAAWAVACVIGFAVMCDMFLIEFTLLAASFAAQLILHKALTNNKLNIN